ncbi:conserved hypothetical protein [uncultured Sporomusa sp.]|uniref:Bacterial EndoU nuclease domain-containing protein n=1 Tax=uncultured Sporomusa sp. TaxID=307249 RepID=A0A212LZM0_9FIRM|nr:CdiA family toxin C-terminal domain-containing protein [uncultured Sporomusa sp.]SCM83035.1 conserved hypothetical protein [uncultured Sporomusa sp.]
MGRGCNCIRLGISGGSLVGGIGTGVKTAEEAAAAARAAAAAKAAEEANKAIRIGENVENHLVKVEGYSQKYGVSGGHNLDEFMKTVNEKSIKIVQETPHYDIPGIAQIEYQVPSLDRALQPTGEYKATIFKKTVYDSSIISDAKMAEWGKQAAAEAMNAGRINGTTWEGYAQNGLKFVGYLDENGAVKNFYPTLSK